MNEKFHRGCPWLKTIINIQKKCNKIIDRLSGVSLQNFSGNFYNYSLFFLFQRVYKKVIYHFINQILYGIICKKTA